MLEQRSSRCCRRRPRRASRAEHPSEPPPARRLPPTAVGDVPPARRAAQRGQYRDRRRSLPGCGRRRTRRERRRRRGASGRRGGRGRGPSPASATGPPGRSVEARSTGVPNCAWRFSTLAITASNWFGVPMTSAIARRSSVNCSAAPSLARRLNRRFAPRTASGLRPAISAASSRASATGFSLSRVARPRAAASRPSKIRAVNVNSLATSGRTSRDRKSVPVMSGTNPQCASRTEVGCPDGRCGCQRRGRSAAHRRVRVHERRRSPGPQAPATPRRPADRDG